MRVPYEVTQELVYLFSGKPEIWKQISPIIWKKWNEEHTPAEIDTILNLIRPFATLRFSDPGEFLKLLKDNPDELKWAAEKPARVQQCIRKLEEVLNPQPLQLPPGRGGGSIWLGLSEDDPLKDLL